MTAVIFSNFPLAILFDYLIKLYKIPYFLILRSDWGILVIHNCNGWL